MDMFEQISSVYTSKRYENIYDFFRNKYKINSGQLYVLCAVIGFTKNKALPLKDRGKEIKTDYFDSRQRSTLYTVILLDRELSEDIEKTLSQLANRVFAEQAISRLNSFAEAGMDLLVNEVFRSCYRNDKLDESYEEYEADILEYIAGS
jgi:hypothetical protein